MTRKNGPIVLQSMWRATSTYWWTKARNNPDLIAFNEPLHENLLVNTDAQFDEVHRNLGKSLRHTKTDRHPFSEYTLKAEGGVEGFKERFSIHDFHMQPEAEDPELAAYLKSLRDTAQENGKRPFFKFTRGFLRAEWIAGQFTDETNIYLNRNPAGIFTSYQSFHGMHSYYFKGLAEVIRANQDNPLFAEFAEHSGLTDDIKAYKVKDLQPRADMIFFIWSLGMASATRYADMVIDSDVLAESGNIEPLQQDLATATQTAWDLTDYKYKKPKTAFLSASDATLDITRRAIETLDPDWDKTDNWRLAGSTRSYIDSLKP